MSKFRLLVLGVLGWAAFFVMAEIVAAILPMCEDPFNAVLYFLLSLPFGFVVPFSLRSFQRMHRHRNRWATFSAATLAVDAVLLVCLFLLVVEWVHYWNRIWWM